MHFLVSVYGSRHLGLLLNLLHSLARVHAGDRVTVYWQDIPDRFREALPRAFPAAEFRETTFDFRSDAILRISSKVLAWTRAVEEHVGEPQLCLLDADTLVLRPLHRFFGEHPEAEVLITHNPDEFNPDRALINSGVLLLRGGEPSAAFMRAWRDETLRIIADPARYAQANDHSLPYGAADQMALHHLLGYRKEIARYKIVAEARRVRVHAVRSWELNETNSRPLDDRTHVVHYKGGWQHLLLAGRPFSRFRPRRASWEMFVLFHRQFSEALRHLNSVASAPFRASDLGIVVPWYYLPPARFSLPLYALWRVKEAAKRAWLLARGRV